MYEIYCVCLHTIDNLLRHGTSKLDYETRIKFLCQLHTTQIIYINLRNPGAFLKLKYVLPLVTLMLSITSIYATFFGLTDHSQAFKFIILKLKTKFTYMF